MMKNEEVSQILKEIGNTHVHPSIIYQKLQCLKSSFKEESDDLEVIYNLSEAHSPGLRFKTILRYEKQSKNTATNEISPQLSSKEALLMKCPLQPINISVKEMLNQIKDMPEEWTIVQLTPKYNNRDEFNEKSDVYYTNPIYISVFKCGKNQPKPFLVTVKAPSDPVSGKPVQLAKEMGDIIKGNKESLMSQTNQKFRNQNEKITYLSRRQFIEDRLRSLIIDIQNLWLKEWRCLLTGKYCDRELEEKIQREIRKFFKEKVQDIDLSQKNEVILTSLVKCCLELKLTEVKSAVQYCFPEIKDKNTIRNIVQFLRSSGADMVINAVNTRKYPVILVLHDTLDCFPWEMIDVLQDEPLTRLPSLHFVYCLFKEHENDIVNGYKIVTDYKNGSYIVNPERDLTNMETRMMTFFNYWTPTWSGTSGYQPKKEEFLDIITSSDIFSYNGHGSGSHLLSIENVQKRHVKAVVLLFGCGSTKLRRMDPQVEMYGSYHTYLIARCPCVVGMLWEVTDVDTDILTTDFISYWIPSAAPVHWKHVDKMKWKKAEDKIEFAKNVKIVEEGKNWEPELLRALCLSKKGLAYLGTKAACIVRGLPVKIQTNS